VLLNSAAAIHIARPNVSIADAVSIAKEIIDSGKALKQLDQFIALSVRTIA
jgi:anthranilate phosphoribosyltransferase